MAHLEALLPYFAALSLFLVVNEVLLVPEEEFDIEESRSAISQDFLPRLPRSAQMNASESRRPTNMKSSEASVKPRRHTAQLVSSTTTPSLVAKFNHSITCSSYEWKCHGSDGVCIDLSQRCDNNPDCSDASDEFGCQDCDPARFFICRNKECISKFFVCDGNPDCADHSDEQNCDENKGACTFDNFRCKNSHCIPFGWKCDGKADCADNSDEENCPEPPKCAPSQFRCQNQLCISNDYLCDGEIDCKDGEDEENCVAARCNKNPNYYQCKTGECIKPEKVCDGHKDCVDGSDEDGLCSRTCKDDDCSHQCFSTPVGPHCLCQKGYSLAPDEKACLDLNECTANISVCDHFCENLLGNFKCSCATGYRLKSDNKTCLIESSRPGFLLIAKNEEIRELQIGATSYRRIILGERPIKCVAYDPVDDRVYWSDSLGVFQKKRQNEVLPVLVIKEGIQQVESIAVDWYGRNLYIADSLMHRIIVCTLTGLRCKVLIDNLPDPRVIQLDIGNRLMFWAERENKKIERAGMDGTKRMTLVTDSLGSPNGLALDQPAKRVYWMNANLSKVEHVNYDGNDRKHLPDGVIFQPVSMAIWENKIYWADLRHEYIYSCLKRNGKSVKIILESVSNDFTGIALFHPTITDQGRNPCQSNRCSHICLLSPRSHSRYTCACPVEMELTDDRHSCRGRNGVSYLLIADGNKFYKMIGGLIGQSSLVSWDLRFKFERIGDFDYDPMERTVIVSDTFAKVIVKIYLDTDRASPIVNDINAVAVAVDWLRNNVYWIDGVKRIIEVVSMFGLYRKALDTNIYLPTDIAVAPVEGFMFIADAGALPSIMRCDLDGSNCTRIVVSYMTQPISITVIMGSDIKRVYWCDLQEGRIESIAFDGTSRKVEKDKLQRPVSLYVSDHYFMWTGEGQAYMYKSSKNTNIITPHILALRPSTYGVRVLQLQNVGWIKNASSISQPCIHRNISCSQLCLGNSTHKQVCSCGIGFELAENGFMCVPYSCHKNQFLCPRNKTCIPSRWRCDGTNDCSDGGDEEDCDIQHNNCSNNEFKCDSGNCINKHWLCDGYNDCSDGSDETLPECKNTSCRSNQFQCKSGQCIPSMWRCDRVKECDDGSDEDDCPRDCGKHKFLCNDGNCIPNMWHCDGSKDCNDGSDELNCEGLVEKLLDPSLKKCNEREIMCDSRNGSIVCVPENKRCDGVMDCPLGEDENCTRCEASQFKCIVGDMCIPNSWKCDGVKDCDDESDEQGCPDLLMNLTLPKSTIKTTTTTAASDWMCHINQFQCYNGQCIPGTQVCDGQADCDDGSDEFNHCYQTCDKKNGGCQHKCRSTPDGVICSCNAGFYLDSDRTSCLDIRECEYEATCSHFCEEMKGSYMCSCMEGYALEPDRRSCKSKANKEWALLIGSESVLNMSLNLALASRIPAMKRVSISSISYDPTTDAIFYTDAVEGQVGMMFMTHRENSEFEVDNILLQRSNPLGLSLDRITGNIYFSEYFVDPLTITSPDENVDSKVKREQPALQNVFSVIQLCNIKGQCRQIVRAFNIKVPSTQVASEHKMLFYCMNHLSQENRAEIMMSNLDGGLPESIHNTKMVHCGSLALDELKKKVYWTDMVLNTVECIAFDGFDHQIFRKNEAHHPIGLTIAGDWVMWFNIHGNQLVRCNKYKRICEKKLLPTEDREKKFESGALLVTHPPRKYENKCAEKNCSQLCTVVFDEAKCMCQVGYIESQEDPTVCHEIISCKDNPCVVGVCEPLSRSSLVCRCPSGNKGLRCEVQISLVELANNTGTAVVVVIILLLAIGIVLGIIWYKKQPFIIWKAKGRRANQTYRFSNPAFGVLSDTAIMTNSPAPSSCASQGNNPPSYGVINTQQPHSNFENPLFKAEDHQANTSLDSTSLNIAPHQISLDTPCPVLEAPPPPPQERKEWILSPYNPLPL